jgi:glycine/D-amino acid oxidase-like deaminating enzyme
MEVDVVIIGSGAAGLTTAVVAAQAGPAAFLFTTRKLLGYLRDLVRFGRGPISPMAMPWLVDCSGRRSTPKSSFGAAHRP